MAREVLIPKKWEYTKQIQKNNPKKQKKVRKQQKQPQKLENIDSTEDSEGKKTRKIHWLRNVILKDTLGKLAEKWKN